jgi:hypothetical protein
LTENEEEITKLEAAIKTQQTALKHNETDMKIQVDKSLNV